MEEELQKKQAIQRKENGKTDHLGNSSQGGASLKPPPSPFSWFRRIFGGGSQNTNDNQVDNSNQVATPKETGTTGNVNKYQTEKPYGWKYGYDFTVGSDTANINMKVNFDAQKGVTAADVTRIQAETQTVVAKYYNKKHKLTDKATGKSVPVSFTVQFVDKGEHLKVKLHPGDGRDNLSNWYVNSKPIVRAHEMGHQLGLKDEYIDTNTTTRATAKSPGVFTDNSIMGNFWAQGVETAELKDRHTSMLANDMSSASGKKYTME